ncbi:MAG TPA: hypothetical protein VKB89_17340 [Xanthobacteraceae bacterium]|nr:hypothetical protein [Xanthobacteraceae bacterium]
MPFMVFPVDPRKIAALAARAQQGTMPVVGLLELAERLRGFREGLKDSGFVEGQNVAID